MLHVAMYGKVGIFSVSSASFFMMASLWRLLVFVFLDCVQLKGEIHCYYNIQCTTKTSAGFAG